MLAHAGIGWAVGFAVGFAGSGVHSALTAVLLGTGIGWVTGFAPTFEAQPAAGSRADSAVEIVLLAHADIGWVIDFVETSVVLVPAGIGWGRWLCCGLGCCICCWLGGRTCCPDCRAAWYWYWLGDWFCCSICGTAC